MMLRLACWAVVAATALPAQAAGDAFAAAVADSRAGRHAAAFASWQQQFTAAGEAAGAELRWNLALAALRVQRSGDAEAAVAGWLTGADPARRGDAEFVAALAACQRAERAAMAAALPDAEPMAWTIAVQSMERAVAGFQRAELARQGWPEAQRNAARATQRLAELRRLRDQAQTPKSKQDSAPVPPAPQPAAPLPEEQPVVLPEERLSANELEAVRRLVATREQTKQQGRRERQARAGVVVERGW